MPRYMIGDAEVAVNQATAEQVAPPGTLSPADAAKKDALKDAKNAPSAASSINSSHVLLAALVLGAGYVAYKDSKKKSGGGGHVIRR